MTFRPITLEFIKSRCRIDPRTECWEWANCIDDKGNAKIRVAGKTWYVRRLVYQLVNGSLPAKKDIVPECLSKSCCNPEHQLALTRSQHQELTASQGRVSKGLVHSLAVLTAARARAKLSIEKARQIRARAAAGAMVESLATDFEVSVDSIRLVIAQKTWREHTNIFGL